MLDTRSIGRGRQIDYADYVDASGNFDAVGSAAALGDTSRSLLGTPRHDWRPPR